MFKPLIFNAFNPKPSIWLGAFLQTACIFISPTVNANIIDDIYGAGAGSFELGAFIDNSGGGYMRLSPGSTTITGWTVGGPGGGVDWTIAPAYRADTGVHAVDLRNLTPSSIATVIPTNSGEVYQLTFGATSGGFPTNTGLITAGSLVNQVFAAVIDTNTNPATQTFTPFTFLFTATESATTIQFTAQGGIGGRYGPVIDSVSVDLVSAPPPTSVPEPSSMALLLLGSGALFVRRRADRHCGMSNA